MVIPPVSMDTGRITSIVGRTQSTSDIHHSNLVLLQLLTYRETILHSCFIGEGYHFKIAIMRTQSQNVNNLEEPSLHFVFDEESLGSIILFIKLCASQL